MMAKLFWPKQKLVNASFGEKQFWTENERGKLVNLKHSYGSELLDLRFW
jgi:hypothetical protein